MMEYNCVNNVDAMMYDMADKADTAIWKLAHACAKNRTKAQMIDDINEVFDLIVEIKKRHDRILKASQQVRPQERRKMKIATINYIQEILRENVENAKVKYRDEQFRLCMCKDGIEEERTTRRQEYITDCARKAYDKALEALEDFENHDWQL